MKDATKLRRPEKMPPTRREDHDVTFLNASGRRSRIALSFLRPGTFLGSGIFLTLLGFGALPATAATFTVDSIADAGDAAPGDGVCDDGSGACTLRAAIREANSLSGADTIELPAGTYVLTIPGKSEDSAATGDLDIRSDLTLVGAGPDVTIIDGDELDRVFELPGTSAPYTALLSGVTIRNGDANDSGIGWGGGVSVTNGLSTTPVTLTLEDVVLTANTASANGCGLFVQGNNTTILDSSVVHTHDCPGLSGAGVHARGNLEVYETTFRDNVGGGGGGIHAQGPSTLIEDSVFLRNSALDGGAIKHPFGGDTLTVRRTLFEENTAVQVGFSGGQGGVLSNGGVARFYDSEFRNNDSENSGGVFFSSSGSDTLLEVHRSLVVGNSARYFGAAAWIGSGNGTFVNTTFSGNVCGDVTDDFGDGCVAILGGGALTLTNSTLQGNENLRGGSTAFEIQSGTATMTSTIIAGSVGGPSCSSALTSGGYNIDDGTSCGLTSTGDQSSTDPLLDPLADNGGPTRTHALQVGSPARDAADSPECPSEDQRGAPRPADGDGDLVAICDVGAYESVPEADLSITKDDGQSTATPGTAVTYSITVANAGPDASLGAVVTDPFDDPPFDRSQVSWTCDPDPGSGSGTTCPVNGTGDDLAAGVEVGVEASASLTFTATAPVRPDATGTLENPVTVESTSTLDPNDANDVASDVDQLAPEADLSITKDDGVDEVIPGGQLTYTITVGNAGPSDEPAATVSDSFPGSLSCDWTCVPSSGASCPSGPVAGDIDAEVSLPAGTSAVFTADCQVAGEASGSIVNVASIASSSGVDDPEPANDSSEDTTDAISEVDLAVAKDDGRDFAEIGGALTYTILVSNSAGPSDAPGTTVTDTFPAELTCTWTCAGAGGGTCGAASGSGDLAETVDLPAGGSVTYTVDCAIDAGSSPGVITNTATAAPASGVTDVDPSNDSGSDSTELTTCGEPNDLVLQTQTISTTETFTACQTITAGNGFVVDGTGNVTFRAGATVTLGADFSVEAGGGLTVEIDPILGE